MDFKLLSPRKVAEFYENKGGRFDIIRYRNVLYKALDECGDDQIMFIPIIGPYQTGKSTFLSVLLQNDNIKIGNASEEQTMGVELYGPIDFKTLKRHYGIHADPTQHLKIFFVDTQGYGGFTVGNFEENKINITRLISTFIPLSQVVLLYTKSNFTTDTAETLDEFFNLMAFCFDSFEEKDMKIVNITRLNGRPNGINYSNPDRKKYSDICNFLASVQASKFNKIRVDNFIPFPYYNKTLQPSFLNLNNQNFADGFRFLIQDLFTIIDNVSYNLQFDRFRIKKIYEYYSKETSNKSFEAFANISRKNADLSVLTKEVNTKFEKIIKNKISKFKLKLKREKDRPDYPFIKGYKNYKSFLSEIKEQMDILISHNLTYKEDLVGMYRYNIEQNFKTQCLEAINEFEEVLLDDQIEVLLSTIKRKIDKLYNEELNRIETFRRNNNQRYQLEGFNSRVNDKIENFINELRRKSALGPAIAEVQSQAEIYKNEKQVELESRARNKSYYLSNHDFSDSSDSSDSSSGGHFNIYPMLNIVDSLLRFIF